MKILQLFLMNMALVIQYAKNAIKRSWKMRKIIENNKKLIIHILNFVLFLLPVIASLYMYLFGFKFDGEQQFALSLMLIIGMTILYINSMPEL